MADDQKVGGVMREEILVENLCVSCSDKVLYLHSVEEKILEPWGVSTIETGATVSAESGVTRKISLRPCLEAFGVDAILADVDPSYSGKIIVTLSNLSDIPILIQRGIWFANLTSSSSEVFNERNPPDSSH